MGRIPKSIDMIIPGKCCLPPKTGLQSRVLHMPLELLDRHRVEACLLMIFKSLSLVDHWIRVACTKELLQRREPFGVQQFSYRASPTSLMHLLSCPKSKFKRFSKSCKVSLAGDEIQLLQMCVVLGTLWQEVVRNLV